MSARESGEANPVSAFSAESRETTSTAIRVGRSMLVDRPHICAFFNGSDDEYQALIPFILDGFASGQKAVHTVDPARREEHLRRLAKAGVEVEALQQRDQLELRDWDNTHLLGGRFDADRTLSLFEELVNKAKRQGFPLTRFVTQMEWALQGCPDTDDLLEYEAKANQIWLQPNGPVNPVICTYDIRNFRGDVVVDVMRTHPLTIIGGVLQENPFFVPPEQFLRELRERRRARNKR